jgi:hypothetical protein
MASSETRRYAEDLKMTLRDVEPELSDVLVPNCVYRCGCPENGKCQLFKNLIKIDPDLTSTDIQKRYDAYNKFFYGDQDNSKGEAGERN